MALENQTPTTDLFNQLVRLNTRGLEIQEEDLVKRAEADEVSRQNKALDVESALGDFTINIRKADRGIREQWLSTAGSAAGILTYSPGRNGVARPLMSTVSFVRGLIGVYDAYQDRDDLIEKRDAYQQRVDEGKTTDRSPGMLAGPGGM